MTDHATLYAEAVLGKEAEEWLKSDVGRYLVARAEEEEKDALELLASASPWRRRRIQDLQARIWRAQMFKQWLGEMVITGRQALNQLEQQPE